MNVILYLHLLVLVLLHLVITVQSLHHLYTQQVLLEFLLGCEEILSETNARIRVYQLNDTKYSKIEMCDACNES